MDRGRRRPGQSSIVTQRKESDTVQVLSGVFEGRTTGTPIALLIPNEDQRSRENDRRWHRKQERAIETRIGEQHPVLRGKEKPDADKGKPGVDGATVQAVEPPQRALFGAGVDIGGFGRCCFGHLNLLGQGGAGCQYLPVRFLQGRASSGSDDRHR